MSARRVMLPKSLVNLVIDTDAHLVDGEADQVVELEGHVWASIVAAADREDRRDPETLREFDDAEELRRLRVAQQRWIGEEQAQALELIKLRAFIDTDQSNDVIALRAKVAQLEAVIATSQNIPELLELRAFKAAVVQAMGGREWAGDNYLIEAIATDRARSEELADQRLTALDEADEVDAELEDLRAFVLAVREHVFGVDPQSWPQNPDLATLTERVKQKSDEASEAKELLFQLEGLRAFKAADDKRRESMTFSKTEPQVLVWRDEADMNKTPVELVDGGLGNVRLLLESGEGCVLSLAVAREHANDVLRKIDAELFKPTTPKKKRAKKTKAAAFDPLPPPKKTPPFVDTSSNVHHADDGQIDLEDVTGAA